MCSFLYKRPIYPLNYILKIPGIFSDTRTFYYVYCMGVFLLVTNACALNELVFGNTTHTSYEYLN